MEFPPNGYRIPAFLIALWAVTLASAATVTPSPAPAASPTAKPSPAAVQPSPRPSPAASPVASTPAAAANEPGVMTDATGQYIVRFPAPPIRATRPGSGLELNLWVLKQPHVELTFGFKSMHDAAVGNPDDVIDRVRDHFLEGAKATVIGEKPLEMKGCTGRQIKYRVGNVTKGVIRYFLNSERLYTLNAAIDLATPLPPSVKPFLTSLKVDPLRYRLDSEDKRTVIWFPGKPAHSTVSKWVKGREVVHQIYAYETEGGQLAYFVGHLDFPETPDASDQKIFNDLRTSMLASFRMALVSESAITFKQYPGRQFEGQSNQGMRLRMRIYSVDNSVYMIYVVSMPGHQPGKLDDLFLESFAVNDGR